MKSFALGGGCIAERPELAVLAMQVIDIWSTANAVIGEMIVDLLHAQPEIAMAMLQAVRSQKTQRAAVLGAAHEALLPDDYLLFEATLSATKFSEDTRDEFAHHMWGYSPDLPDSLLLVNPKYHNKYMASLKNIGIAQPLAIDKKEIIEWTETKLHGAVKDARRAAENIGLLASLTRWKFAGRPAISMRQQLLTDPEIQRKILNRSKPLP